MREKCHREYRGLLKIGEQALFDQRGRIRGMLAAGGEGGEAQPRLWK